MSLTRKCRSIFEDTALTEQRELILIDGMRPADGAVPLLLVPLGDAVGMEGVVAVKRRQLLATVQRTDADGTLFFRTGQGLVQNTEKKA